MSVLRRDRIEIGKKFAFEFTSDSAAFIESLDEDGEPYVGLEVDEMISLAEWLADAIKYKQMMNQRVDAKEMETERDVLKALGLPEEVVIPF